MKRFVCVIIAVNDSIQSLAAADKNSSSSSSRYSSALEEFRIMSQHRNSLAVDTVYVA